MKESNISQAPLEFGVKEIEGYPVPDRFRFDVEFLSQPKDVKLYILQQINKGSLVVKEDSAVSKTVRRTVRLFTGQWENLSELAGKCVPFEEDRRRSITENTFLRQFLSLGITFIAPHMDCSSISTEDELRGELVRAFQQAGKQGLHE